MFEFGICPEFNICVSIEKLLSVERIPIKVTEGEELVFVI